MSPLAKIDKDKLTYTQDIEKFSKFIEHLQLRKEKFIETISRLEEDNNSIGTHNFLIIELEAELSTIDSSRAELQAQVDAQDVSPEDIDRMNSEKEVLAKNLETIIAAKEEASKQFWDRELFAQKQLDIVEKLIIEYSQAIERINKNLLDTCGLSHNQLSIAIKSSSMAGSSEPIIDKNMDEEVMVLISINFLIYSPFWSKFVMSFKSDCINCKKSIWRYLKLLNRLKKGCPRIEMKWKLVKTRSRRLACNTIARRRY